MTMVTWAPEDAWKKQRLAAATHELLQGLGIHQLGMETGREWAELIGAVLGTAPKALRRPLWCREDEEIAPLPKGFLARLVDLEGIDNELRAAARTAHDSGKEGCLWLSEPRPVIMPRCADAPLLKAPGIKKTAPSFLTPLSVDGELAPRTADEDRVLEVLCQLRDPHPLISGPRGSGKSTTLQLVARRIARRDAPPRLQGLAVRQLNCTELFAGTYGRGDILSRVKDAVGYLEGAPTVVVLDDLDRLVDRRNPTARAGLELVLTAMMEVAGTRVVAVASDDAVTKIGASLPILERFTVVPLAPMTPEVATPLLRILRSNLETHHAVQISETILVRAVRLVQAHLGDRALPGSAVDILDLAAAKAAIAGDEKVDESTLLEAIADTLRVPVEHLQLDGKARLLDIEDVLGQRVFGQEEAIRSLAEVVRLTKAEMDLHPERPDGVFLFVGPTGVGKTELAKALAEVLDPVHPAPVRLDMSEFAEKFTASRLLGSPPGYVDSDRGGQLTEALRKRPTALVLLDEIEKAHPKIFDILLQVFDAGRVTDALGGQVDCSRATFIMTSNVGARSLTCPRVGFLAKADDIGASTSVDDALRSTFRPEFLNRIDAVIQFRPLSVAVLTKIAEKSLDELRARFAAKGIQVSFSPRVAQQLIGGIDRLRTGARGVKRRIERKIAAPLTRYLLAGDFDRAIYVDATSDGIELIREPVLS